MRFDYFDEENQTDDAATLGDYGNKSTPAWYEDQTLTAVGLTSMIVCMIFGNILVIVAVVVERELRCSQNYLILSLAVADLLVGTVVSPLAALYEMHKEWRFGYLMCDVWTCFDVLVCTASILHLVAIALDRYWSITDVAYSRNRTGRRVLAMIGVVWSVSLVISVAPLMGWKDRGFVDRLEHRQCMISQDIVYQIFSTTTAFYAPLVLICVLYYKIFKAAQHRIRLQEQRRSSVALNLNGKTKVVADEDDLIRRRFGDQMQKLSLPCDASEIRAKPLRLMGSLDMKRPSVDMLDLVKRCSSSGPEEKKSLDDSSARKEIRMLSSKTSLLTISSSSGTPPKKLSLSYGERFSSSSLLDGKKFRMRKHRESTETKRERRAGRTLAIITGVFVVCWVPFFVLALYRPICASTSDVSACRIPATLESFLSWLGYTNSALNPILYTIFSPDFRRAFQKIVRKLCLSFFCCSPISVRNVGKPM